MKKSKAKSTTRSALKKTPTKAQTLRPMCFIAMPFGKRAPVGKKKPLIDFNRIHSYIAAAVEAAGLEPIRADFEPGGGFIHKPMLERLLVAEYVIADLTLSNPNVMYEVGLRHGASARATLLLCGEAFLSGLPFDVRPLRVLSYGLTKLGAITKSAGEQLQASLKERLDLARSGQLPVDNPIMQVTSWKPSGNVEHSKTDVFLQRLQFTGKLGERIQAAVALPDKVKAISDLSAIEAEVVDLPNEISEVHTVLLGVFLGYREKKAYDKMTALFERFPKELKQTAVSLEQLALALNRLAEQASSGGDSEKAEGLRRRALQALDQIAPDSVTSETYGIRGRIYKGWHDALASLPDRQDQARATLQQAINTYEQGFRADLRDYYPGINAVTLRLLRGTPADADALRVLIPVVRYSVAAAPQPENTEERYWQNATKLELATAAGDWMKAKEHLTDLLGLDVQSWMRETTAENLKRQQKAFGDNTTAVAELQSLINALTKV